MNSAWFAICTQTLATGGNCNNWSKSEKYHMIMKVWHNPDYGKLWPHHASPIYLSWSAPYDVLVSILLYHELRVYRNRSPRRTVEQRHICSRTFIASPFANRRQPITPLTGSIYPSAIAISWNQCKALSIEARSAQMNIFRHTGHHQSSQRGKEFLWTHNAKEERKTKEEFYQGTKEARKRYQGANLYRKMK